MGHHRICGPSLTETSLCSAYLYFLDLHINSPFSSTSAFPILCLVLFRNKNILCIPHIKVRVKVTLVQALRLCTGRTAHRGSRGIALPFHDHGTRRHEGSASRPGCSLPPGKDPVPILQEAGWAQGRSGQLQKISPPPGFDPQTVQSIASRYTD